MAETRYILGNIISAKILSSDRGQNCAQQRKEKSTPLNYELLLARERHSLVGHLAECGFVLTQFTRDRN